MNLPRLILVLVALLLALSLLALAAAARAQEAPQTLNYTYLPLVKNNGISWDYVVLAWNDLGMHCYDRDYTDMMVLPPYNNLWAQVIKRGDPPEIVTTGVTVNYSYPTNTYSVGKTNFWTYAQKLFGVALAPNIGLKGKGLSGTLDPQTGYFVAEGIPVTEYSDNALNTPNYFQEATVTVTDASGNFLANTIAVTPISSEMRCDTCHNRPYADFRLNILAKHDEEEGTKFVAQAQSGNPVVCANCHADPALGMSGQPGLPSLSAAMHSQHAEETSNCYACHPGPNTRCLRDVMSEQHGLTCTNCHVGGMNMLASETRTPWVDEPRCQDCHDAQYAENPGQLYRHSTGHGGVYCEACHNSTHAITPSREPADNKQAILLQGTAGSIQRCTVCHLSQPSTGGPHH